MSGAGNFGKYIDHNPIICAAGKRFGDPSDTLASTLKWYSLQEEVDTLKHEAGIYDDRAPQFKYGLPRLQNYRHCGSYTEIRPLMRQPVKTRYQTLVNDLKDTPYASFWKSEEGKSRDPYGGLPAGFDIKGTTFGDSSKKEFPVRETVNPPKSSLQVVLESEAGHDMYKKTHNDYNPGEQVDRGYLRPAFNPNKCFGERTAYDPRGIWVRCACNWYKADPLVTCNQIQADVAEQTRNVLGKPLTPNHNIDCVPKGHRFGKPIKRHLYGMEELLKDHDRPPCIVKRDYHDWMKHLNEMRRKLKRRKNTFDFSLTEFHEAIKFHDQDDTGWVPLDLLYRVCKSYDVNFEHEMLEPLLSLIGAITPEGLVNHKVFIELVDINTSVPELVKIDDIPLKNQYYSTTFRSANCDFLQMDNSDMPAAGKPTIRFDLPQLQTPEGGCQADIASFGSETASGALINPSIYTNYGCSYRDFYMPRSPELLRKIFENIGYQFPGDTFDKLWKIGVELDKTGLVCVDTFKKLIQDSLPPPTFKINQDDVKC